MRRWTGLRAGLLTGALLAGALAALGAGSGGEDGRARAQTAPTVLLLGDSLTWGQTGPATALAGGFRAPLHDLLDARGVPHRFAGSRTDNPSPALAAAGQDAHEGWPGFRVDQAAALLPPAPPDAAVVLLGTNDVAQRQDPAAVAVRLDALLRRLEPAPVVVVAPPPYLAQGADEQPDPASTAWDRALREVVAAAGAAGRPVRLADGWAPFVRDGRVDRALVAPDGTHLTAAGYAALAEAVAPVLAEALAG